LQAIFLGDPAFLVRILVVGVFACVALARLSGKRTLSSMNAFDFIINVAIGSILASTIVSLAEKCGKSGVPERKVPVPGAFRYMVQFFSYSQTINCPGL
jgi:hypothetical protein